MSIPTIDASEKQAGSDGVTEFRRQETLLKTGALQDAIFNSANFSSIATDAKGVIQIFNVGAERMLGYTAVARAITSCGSEMSAGVIWFITSRPHILACARPRR